MKITPETIISIIETNPINFALRLTVLNGLNRAIPWLPIPVLGLGEPTGTISLTHHEVSGDPNYNSVLTVIATERLIVPFILLDNTRPQEKNPGNNKARGWPSQLRDLLADSRNPNVPAIVKQNLAGLEGVLSRMDPTPFIREAAVRFSVLYALTNSEVFIHPVLMEAQKTEGIVLEELPQCIVVSPDQKSFVGVTKMGGLLISLFEKVRRLHPSDETRRILRTVKAINNMEDHPDTYIATARSTQKVKNRS